MKNFSFAFFLSIILLLEIEPLVNYLAKFPHYQKEITFLPKIIFVPVPTPTPLFIPIKPYPPPATPAWPAGRHNPFPNYNGEDIWLALQTYRQTHQHNQLNKSEKLCELADKRLQQLLELGEIDRHEGFKALNEEELKNYGYQYLGENLAQGYPTAVAVIEWGWDSSTEGHREAQLSDFYTDGCIASQNGLSVLILGKH